MVSVRDAVETAPTRALRRPYPAYKQSGVEWLGPIPAHWSLSRVKHGFHITLGKMLQPDADGPDDQLIPYLRAANVMSGRPDTTDVKEMWASPQERLQLELRSGDVLVCEGGDVGRACIWDGSVEPCIFQNAVHRLRPRFGHDAKFLCYVLCCAKATGWFDTLCNRATILHLTGEKLANTALPLPTLPEQRAIAAFLDRETARIDALIAKKRQLIELLGERRRATIHHLLTNGLVAGVELKPSGVEWMGDIPAHWRTVRNKVIFRERDERSENGSEELLTVSHITGVTPRSEKDVNMFLAETTEGYKRVHAGDLVVNTMWAWMGALGFSRYDGIVSPSYNVYSLRPEFRARYSPEYLHMLYRTEGYVADITSRSVGVWTSRLRLYPEAWMNMLTVAPPRDEQNAIVDTLTRELSSDFALTAKLETSVAAMREHRSALIAAAVTGKIDLREAG